MAKKSVSRLFEVGDLVQYTSYYDDPIGPWESKSDLGIVVGIRTVEQDYQVIKVRWLSDNSEVDMAAESLLKVKDLDLDKMEIK